MTCDSRCRGAYLAVFFFFSSRRRHTRCSRDWSSDVCSSDLSEPFTLQCASDRNDEHRPLSDSGRSEEHTSELQSRLHLVCRLLLEKKKKHTIRGETTISTPKSDSQH